jgi:hypothetical protein
LTGYRHDPRIVGKMAAHVVLPWIHRAFSGVAPLNVENERQALLALSL